MPLDKPTLVTTLTNIFSNLNNTTANQKAQDIANAIDTYVKTATVNIPVTGATGSPSTGNLS
ncbi:hypothetical protein [Leptospira langatensis]|nr:hypothetical protein [Leptospira langatensis]